MESKSFVNEKRLRPIYDCLDSGNAKKALQEAEKLLKKKKELLCVQVLKGLALVRLNQPDAAMEILNKLEKEVPTDECTLQAMAICYRELNRPDLISQLYENALKKEPANEDIMVSLFNSYVRIGEFKKQQQIALNLHKLKPFKKSYYFWAIMSVYMQAITNKDPEIARKMLFPLAQRMFQKFIDEDKIDSESQIELFLMILEKQEKFEDILILTDGPLARLLPNYLDFLRRRKAYLYKQTSRYQEAFETFRSMIENNVDQLEYYLQLIDVGFMLDQSANLLKLSNDQVLKNEEDPFIRKVIETFSKHLAVKSDSSFKIKQSGSKVSPDPTTPPVLRYRAPYIARIELYETLKSRCESHPSYNRLLSLITENPTQLYIEFFSLFGHKDASFFDFSYLFTKFNKPKDQLLPIIEAIDKLHGPLMEKKPDTLDEMYRLLSFVKLNYYAGNYSSLDDDTRHTLVAKLIDLYDHSIPFGNDLLPSDFQPADPFILVISYILMNQSTIQDNSKLINLLLVLERSLQKSPSNYNSKVALIKLYNIIGACGCANHWFESMDIKHIQIDTLGYLINDSLLLNSHYSVACSKIASASRFYCGNYKDNYEYLVSFYKIGSFTKIEEIVKLKEKLNISINFSSIELDKLVMALVIVTKSPDVTTHAINTIEVDLDKIEGDCDKFVDNRDFSIFRVLSHETWKEAEKNRNRWFSDQAKWIKLRHLLLKTLIIGHCSLNKGSETETPAKSTVTNSTAAKLNGNDFPKFIETLEKLEIYYQSLRKESIYLNAFPLQGSQPSRINYYLQRDHVGVLIAIYSQIRAVHESSPEIKVSWNDSWLIDLKDMINESIIALKVARTFHEMGKVFIDLSFIVETICFAVILLGLINIPLAKDVQESKKTKKKRNPEIVNNLNQLVESYNKSLTELSVCMKFILSSLDEFDIAHIINSPVDLGLFASGGTFLQKAEDYKTTYEDTIAKIDQSYQKTARQLHSTVAMKLKYLNLIKL